MPPMPSAALAGRKHAARERQHVVHGRVALRRRSRARAGASPPRVDQRLHQLEQLVAGGSPSSPGTGNRAVASVSRPGSGAVVVRRGLRGPERGCRAVCGHVDVFRAVRALRPLRWPVSATHPLALDRSATGSGQQVPSWSRGLLGHDPLRPPWAACPSSAHSGSDPP